MQHHSPVSWGLWPSYIIVLGIHEYYSTYKLFLLGLAPGRG